MNRTALRAADLLAVVFAVGIAAGASATPVASAEDAVLEWNAIATEAMVAFTAANPPGVPPNREARIYAMTFAAMHDTLNAIHRRYRPLVCDTSEPGASPAVAVMTAAHDVLVAAFPPAAAAADAAYYGAIRGMIPNERTFRGVMLGQRCARAMLAARALDGADLAQVPFVPGPNPGDYQFTFPFDQPGPAYGFVADPLWGNVLPFSLLTSAQFRSAPPYPLGSAAYAADVNEVQARGGMFGSNRTADESEIAIFWRENSPLGWNRIARTVAAGRQCDAWDRARLFALLQVAEADAYLASFETKFHYNYWRPITAIHLADTDGNAATTADPTWLPFDPVTPPVPDYSSAHSTAGGAARAVLATYFGNDDIAFAQTSTSLPGVTRTYASFTQAADENGLSRILIGYHFRNAVNAGRMQGESVGNWVVTHALLPVH
jgi:hypothetical protein